jgi:hypothetical protein
MKTFITAAALATLMATAATADNLDRSVYVTNDGAGTIKSVFIANFDDETWNDDLLGGQVVRDGYEIQVAPQHVWGDCRFDVRVEFTDDAYVELYDVNLCQTDSIVATWDGAYLELAGGGTSGFYDASY